MKTPILTLALMLAASLYAEPVELGSLIEADWIDQDAAFAEAEAVDTFSREHMNDTIARGRALAERLRMDANGARLDDLLGQLAAAADRAEASPEDARRESYLALRRVVRDIAFCNPLLDIDTLLFVKRHDAKGVFHMCDQFYGFNAVAGGGLFVLRDPFGAEPLIENLLDGAAVASGRLEGRALTPGAFLSPEVSFDGQTVLFAYTEARGKDLEWTPESCWHIFRVNADGTGLTQLTDGPWDDFDPCFLPSGRVVFATERRGGYLRCGRHCPVYALYSMRADGGDIQWFSCHETHEWQPSVDNDGMVVYTRWDYVDRDTNVAHHIWQCYPDGRDPRSFHGNYPVKREGRPWMEMDIRAVPGSHKYVAVTGAHHGHAFGSLVLIDRRIGDDGAMAQLERITPDVPFSEAEKHIRPIAKCMVYGTPWPLSEDDYLCVYDRHAANRGIYWIDRYGNKELIYRDPAISCISPMPLAPRPMPPAIPTQTLQFAENAPDTGTVAVMDLYNSDFAWPEGAKAAALRIVQVLPKTTAPPNDPRIGIADQTNARAVLGTVPVEADGSVFFEAPAGKLLYFQAIDERGMAIQSMRSGTYVHPGERLTCLGCHEPKHAVSDKPNRVPLAMQRPPSRIAPEVDGSNPFNYPRLIQPVLDRNCVACHEEKKAL
ncbi:MAG: hypothetical protein QG656_2380, partial [Candidatus Hydrogenedentes bacterium]|nr:hypothetical protein [Candidatus Hydrogenedentota bacterium]